ncbi:MarR family transcriptional regulator [Candidatus Bathyarchaeota archaeon]|nr:MarR family transcriptional regulator [Candidatus Bathyarchaeota archaeon]MBL7079115.1 MarR family transcriptional regulator [Candidatus Bathyarchaeota archaeon]
MELFFATLMLFAVTTIASFIYYKKISQAQEEYEESRDLVRGITNGFTRQISRLTTAISGFESDASDAHRVAAQALEATRVAVEASKAGVDERKLLAERFEGTEKAIEEMKKEIQEISKRPVPLVQAIPMDAPIPLQQRDVLGQLTLTEFDVLTLIDEMGEGSVPEIREKIQKTREHTARLLKKLFDKGFIDRNTSSMPYRYHLRKEIVELVKNHQARNEINL